MRKAFAEYKKSIRDEGHQEGLQEGIQKGHQEGLHEGIQKGHQEGLQEGIQKGHQKGVEESRNKIVTNMLMEHCSIEMIEKYTRLPLEQILQIAKANNIQMP